MINFVTYFDYGYAANGLALIHSLARTQISYRYNLWIICLDLRTFTFLRNLRLPNVTLIQLSDIETDELLSAKQNRSKKEYYWTLTPFVIDYVMHCDPRVDIVTYLDSDIVFYNDAINIISDFEKSDNTVLITPHHYRRFYDQSKTSGTFCVQWVSFKRSDTTKLLSEWKEQCLEWCYAIPLDGLFGDQFYLEDWNVRFPNDVMVLQDPKLIVGPWSVGVNAQISEMIAFHFHGINIYKSSQPFNGNYFIPKNIKELYNMYSKQLNFFDDLFELNLFSSRSKMEFIITHMLKFLWNFKRVFR